MIRGALSSFVEKISSSFSTLSTGRVINYAQHMQWNSFSVSSQLRLNCLSTTLQNNSFNILLQNNQIMHQQIRPVTKFSWKAGTRKSVSVVRRKFFRLHWGIWIRTMAGRHKKLWKKSGSQKNRLQQHVFCNYTQSKMLDKMVTSYWKKPKYYIEDPYEPYHTRENFPFSQTKPWRPKEY